MRQILISCASIIDKFSRMTVLPELEDDAESIDVSIPKDQLFIQLPENIWQPTLELCFDAYWDVELKKDSSYNGWLPCDRVVTCKVMYYAVRFRY